MKRVVPHTLVNRDRLMIRWIESHLFGSYNNNNKYIQLRTRRGNANDLYSEYKEEKEEEIL